MRAEELSLANPECSTQDRINAGTQLASLLKDKKLSNPIAIATTEKGMSIGAVIAKLMHLPLNILIVQKITLADHPSVEIGAMTEGGLYCLNDPSLKKLKINPRELKPSLDRQKALIHEQVELLKTSRPRLKLTGRNIILIDDGLDTSNTVPLAIQFLRQEGVAQIALAVATRSSKKDLQHLENQVNHLVSLDLPSEDIKIKDGNLTLPGSLTIPDHCLGFVLFSHGSGSSRFSPRNQETAKTLNQRGIGTLLFDLLSSDESQCRSKVFNIPFLANRLMIATRWIQNRLNSENHLRNLPLGYFGASTGAGAALWASTQRSNPVTTIVSRGGRPDLAYERLKEVKVSTLLIVGGKDDLVREINQNALKQLHSGRLVTVPGATHLFEEEGALEQVSLIASDWFIRHFSEISAQRPRVA